MADLVDMQMKLDFHGKDVSFYNKRFPQLLFSLCLAIVFLILFALIVLYQVLHRPYPSFHGETISGEQRELMPHSDANLLPSTILNWASKAAVAAYTFSFDPNFAAKQLALSRPYFTVDGWDNYKSSVAGVIQDVTNKQLVVTGVVSGAPVIASQGDNGSGYIWHLQLPFLVTYQASDAIQISYYLILMDVVKVPASENPSGIGINRFVMTAPR